jgi:hypothetical protein
MAKFYFYLHKGSKNFKNKIWPYNISIQFRAGISSLKVAKLGKILYFPRKNNTLFTLSQNIVTYLRLKLSLFYKKRFPFYK